MLSRLNLDFVLTFSCQIHGGGYTLGSKLDTPTPAYFPTGLFAQAQAEKDNMIFVALNYRLGALGFLAGPEVAADGDLNAGLLDQRLALQWVQTNIHLFGGSADRVTIMGESAGAGSVVLQLTAYGGGGPKLFSQVITQSPAGLTTSNNHTDSYTGFLSFLNVSSLEEARGVDTSAIVQANSAQIMAAPTTNYIWGPVVDGGFIPEPFAQMLKEGKFKRDIQVLAAHNSFEGAFFFDPAIQTDDAFRQWIIRSFPGLSNSSLDTLTEIIYPAQFDGSLGYVDQDSRQMALWGEAVILCNFQFICQALQGKNYACESNFSSESRIFFFFFFKKKGLLLINTTDEFAVPPGFHIQDLKYTFNEPETPLHSQKHRILFSMPLSALYRMVFPSWTMEWHFHSMVRKAISSILPPLEATSAEEMSTRLGAHFGRMCNSIEIRLNADMEYLDVIFYSQKKPPIIRMSPTQNCA
jgi:carboxylesterase type B